MLPASAPSIRDAAHPDRVALVVLTITDAQRVALEQWAAKLADYMVQRRACPTREHNSNLRKQFATAIMGAWAAIAAVCAEPRAAIVDEAITAVSRYFTHPGDARAAVRGFPAIVDLAFYLSGPEPLNTLDGLVLQAEAAIRAIERILERGEVWHFDKGGGAGA